MDNRLTDNGGMAESLVYYLLTHEPWNRVSYHQELGSNKSFYFNHIIWFGYSKVKVLMRQLF